MKAGYKHKKSRGPLAQIGIGTAISIILYLLFSLISAAVIGGLGDPLGAVGIASMISFFPPALISGFLISRLFGDGGTLTAGASAFIFVMLAFLCCVVLNHGKIPLTSIVSYIAYFILAVVGGALGKSRARYRRAR